MSRSLQNRPWLTGCRSINPSVSQTPTVLGCHSTDFGIEFGLLDGRTTEQNDTDFAFGVASGSACQTVFDSLSPNSNDYSVNVSDCTAQNYEDWLTNSGLEPLQMSTQETTDYDLEDITIPECAASDSYHPDHRYKAAGGDAVETKDLLQFGDVQCDARQDPPQEYTNPTGLPILNYASTDSFQLPGFQNTFDTSWEGMGFVQTDLSMLHGAESMASNPKSHSGWNTIAYGTPQWNSQTSEVDSAQSDVVPNVMKIDSGDRGASCSSELRDDGACFGLDWMFNEPLANPQFVGDSSDDVDNKIPQFGSSSTQSVDVDFYNSNLPREAYLLRLTKLSPNIETDEFVSNPDGTPRVSPITTTTYKKVDFLPDSIDYRRLNGAILIRAELKGASLKSHIIPRIEPNTLRTRQIASLTEEIEKRREMQLKEEQLIDFEEESDNEKNICQEFQDVREMRIGEDDSSVASEDDEKRNGDLTNEKATDSKVSITARGKINLKTVAERLSRCLSNMKHKYRKEHNLGFAYGANVLKQQKGSTTREPTKEAHRVLEGGLIGIEKLLFVRLLPF